MTSAICWGGRPSGNSALASGAGNISSNPANAVIRLRAALNNERSFILGRVVNGEFRGEVVSGAQPYEFFKAKLDALLAEPR